MKRYRVLLVAFQKKKLIFCHHPNKKFGTSCFIRASQNCRHIHLSTFKKKQKNKKTILKLTTKFPRALFIDTLWFHKILYFLQSPPLDSVQNFNFWLHIQTNVQPYHFFKILVRDMEKSIVNGIQLEIPACRNNALLHRQFFTGLLVRFSWACIGWTSP